MPTGPERSPRVPGRRHWRHWRLRLPAWCHPGRRGAVLLTFAGIYIAYGFSTHPSSPDRAQRLAILYSVAPSHVWQIAWWLVAVIAASRAWSRRDALAFVALETLAALWAGSQWATFILTGNTSAASFAVLFTMVLILLRIIDGWVELPIGFLDPRDPRTADDPRDRRETEDPRDVRDLSRDPPDPRDPRAAWWGDPPEPRDVRARDEDGRES